MKGDAAHRIMIVANESISTGFVWREVLIFGGESFSLELLFGAIS